MKSWAVKRAAREREQAQQEREAAYLANGGAIRPPAAGLEDGERWDGRQPSPPARVEDSFVAVNSNGEWTQPTAAGRFYPRGRYFTGQLASGQAREATPPAPAVRAKPLVEPTWPRARELFHQGRYYADEHSWGHAPRERASTPPAPAERAKPLVEPTWPHSRELFHQGRYYGDQHSWGHAPRARASTPPAPAERKPLVEPTWPHAVDAFQRGRYCADKRAWGFAPRPESPPRPVKRERSLSLSPSARDAKRARLPCTAESSRRDPRSTTDHHHRHHRAAATPRRASPSSSSAAAMGDSYRPPPPPPEFTGRSEGGLRDHEFGFDHPHKLPAGGDSYRPHDSDRSRRGFRGGPGGARGGRGRGRGQPLWQTFQAHDRKLMTSGLGRQPTPELLAGMNSSGMELMPDDNDAVKAEPDDGSDREMSISDDGERRPQPKVGISLRQSPTTADRQTFDEEGLEIVEGKDFVDTERKRQDVIEMIRAYKAKVQGERQAELNRDKVAANDDFISLTFDEPGAESSSSSEDEGDARGGKSRRLNDGSRDDTGYSKDRKNGTRGGLFDVPSTRKRKHHEVTGKAQNGLVLDGNVQDTFVAKPGIDPYPWMQIGADHSRTKEPVMWLHKEIIDFTYFMQPLNYEHAVRRHLIQRVRSIVCQAFPDADVRVFGSFAAELYLPTSDVDLVVVSTGFPEGRPRYDGKRALFTISGRLDAAGMCKSRPTCISNAKVPIVKFVDRLTGIHVDISFENDSGLVANETFNKWKTQFPAMPILVTVIKQFLAQRGLNEVYCGGLGSFAVTCMVVSFLHTHPAVASGRVDPIQNLGNMLLEFLDLYGNRLNADEVGLRIDSAAHACYFPKHTDLPAPPSRRGGGRLLCIQDPNLCDNDISRSSFLISLIQQCFSEACEALTAQMAILYRLSFAQREGRSVLGAIIGGDYTTTLDQRKHLRKIFIDERIGDAAEIEGQIPYPRERLSPPPLPTEPPPPTPPPPPPPPPSEPLRLSKKQKRDSGGNQSRNRGGNSSVNANSNGGGSASGQQLGKKTKRALKRERERAAATTSGGNTQQAGGGKKGRAGTRNDPIPLD